MATLVSREAYFEAGLDVLADLGYGGLKLAQVCRRLGVTSGSFYHYFPSWSAFTDELVDHWRTELPERRLSRLRAEPDPRRRIGGMVDVGLTLPHSTEAAMRTWSSIDPKVRPAQEQVDRKRFELLRDAAFEILDNDRQAQLFAKWAMYLLVGYEQCTLPPDAAGLTWITEQLLNALDSGRFATVGE